MAFSVFFLLGGAGFTLSHYCCNHCRAHHCGTEWAQPSAPESGLPSGTVSAQVQKACGCCFVRHFETDTTEVSQPQALPAAQEVVLFCATMHCGTESVSDGNPTISLERHDSPPNIRFGGKKVLQQVCRWLI